MRKRKSLSLGRAVVGTAVAGALLVLGAAVAEAQRSVLSVTTTEDVLDDNDGVLSLREAIITANGDPGKSYQINLQNGTYRLEIDGREEDSCLTGDLDITGDVLIDGFGGAYNTISGDSIYRVLDVCRRQRADREPV